MDFAIGSFLLTTFEFAPTGTLACNGQLVSPATFPGLFEALGTRYGGDGTTTFGVPNMPPKTTPAGQSLRWVVVTDGPSWGSATEAYIGEVRPLPAPPPTGSGLAQLVVPCDGRTLDIGTNQALYAVMGTQFGGNGTNNFAVPNLPPLAVPNGPALSYWLFVNGLFPPIGGDSVTPTQGNDTQDTYLGAVMLVSYLDSYTRQLQGLALCQGQTMPIAQWTALFSLIGTIYGGNGTSNFLLPVLPTGTDLITYMMVTNGYYPPRS